MTRNNGIIEYTESGKFIVPDMPEIPFIEGDGTGPDIWKATRLVLDAAVGKAFGNSRKIRWMEVYAGEKANGRFGNWLPDETLEAIRSHRIAIKGPLTTPVAKGFRSLNVTLRRELDLYACIRPVKYIPGVPSPMRRPEDVNMVVFRENIEDVYMGLEWQAGSETAKKIIELVRKEEGREIREDSGIGLKPISRFGTRRLVRKALQYAMEYGFGSITLVHKGNIMKHTEGAFRNWGYELAQEELGGQSLTEDELYKKHGGRAPEGKIVIKDRIADNMFQQILLRPAEFGVLAMPNLNGDYMSDALAAMIGGIGMAPGANMGDGYAVFEATHGTAPKYAGKDKVNPSSLLLSGVMMLELMGWKEPGERIQKAIRKTIAQKKVTYDLARNLEGAMEVKCSAFAEAVVENL